MRGLDVKPKTQAGYESLLRSRILPTFGAVKLSSITSAMVRRWVADMVGEGLSASRIRQARAILRQSLEVARVDGLIGANPAQGVKAPVSRRREPRYITAEQVAKLAGQAEHRQKGSGAFVWFLAVTGLRWGEAVALRRSAVDLMRRRVEVHEAVTEISGRLVHGTPKSHFSRTIVIPKVLADRLAPHCARLGADDLVFTSPRGGYLRSANFRRNVWVPALRAAGLDEKLRIHDLRATAASLMVSSGASIKAIQRAFGHASAKMTLDTYAGLFTDDLEALAERMHERLVPVANGPTALETETVGITRLHDAAAG
jgi:integrase